MRERHQAFWLAKRSALFADARSGLFAELFAATLRRVEPGDDVPAVCTATSPPRAAEALSCGRGWQPAHARGIPSAWRVPGAVAPRAAVPDRCGSGPHAAVAAASNRSRAVRWSRHGAERSVALDRRLAARPGGARSKTDPGRRRR